jgi:hypothetical protein
MEERIERILEDKEGLNDKEYIDFITDYYLGKLDEELKIEEGKTESSYCTHEIKNEDRDKLISLFGKSNDLLLYFVERKGLL